METDSNGAVRKRTVEEVAPNNGSASNVQKKRKYHDRDFFFNMVSALCLFIYRLLTLRHVGFQ